MSRKFVKIVSVFAGRPYLFILAALGFSLQARAEPPLAEETCLAYDRRYEEASLMRVKEDVPQGKAFFQKQAKQCPSGASCSFRQKAYVIPRDVVLVGPELRGFRCAYYGTSKGDIFAGFLPASALETAPEGGNLDTRFLAGTWNFLGQNPMVIKSASNGAVQAKGNAIWDGGHGNVNVGEFEATAKPQGNSITFKNTDGDCQVHMRRRGPYLIVDDNSNCGGMNVRFSGIYVKRAK